VGSTTSQAPRTCDSPDFVDFLEHEAGCANHRHAVPSTSRDPSLRVPTPARAEPPRIFLLCPEALGPKARCVEDALRARGYRVWLATGRRARRWVRQAPPGSPSLRVLCVGQIDPELATRLAQGRDDFHVMGLDTPSRMVEEIERLCGRTRSRRTPRPSRMYLAQPTLIEQQLTVQHRWGWSVVAASALLVVGVMGGMMLGSSPRPEPAPKPSMAAKPTPAKPRAVEPRVHEEPVLSAVGPIDSERLANSEPERR